MQDNQVVARRGVEQQSRVNLEDRVEEELV